MVHPTELLRTNSTGDEESFVAPVGDYRNDVDCGCNALPCLSQRLNLEKYAKPGYFVAVLSIVGFFNGIIVKYFRGTSQIWSQHYSISEDTLDWLLYVNELYVGIFALVIAYWGNRMHRPTWLAALTIYLGVSCITLAIPEIYQPIKKEETDINVVNGKVLCQISRSSDIKELSLNINNSFVAFGIVILYQIVYALCTVSFVTHGVTYIDDNISPSQSPAYIAVIFASQRMGKQVGIYSAWIPFIFGQESIFVSVVWLLIAANIIILGTVLGMFPKIMPNTLLRKSVNSLLSIAAGNAVVEDNKTVDGFFKSLWRILKNRVLLLNVIAMTLVQAGIINFNMREKHINQAKYHVSRYNDASGYSDPVLIQFSTNLLKQPLIAVSLVTVGLVIAKIQPRPKYLVLWNIKVFALALVGFAGIRLFSCTNELQNELDGRLTIPYCSWNCGCSLDGPFQPICLNGKTHFSPCWAGCASFDTSLKIYGNCSCGGTGQTVAAEASCDADNCSTLWALAQAHGVVTSALMGTTLITTLIINLRCVSSKDKALALGLHLTFLGLIPYLPVKAVYDVIADNFCRIWGRKTCQFYSEDFALFLSVITICLISVAILISVALLFIVNEVELYTNKNSRKNSDEDLSFLRRPGAISNNNDVNNTNNYNNDNEQITGSQETEDSHPREIETTALVQRPSDIIVRNKQRSDSKLDKLVDRSSKGDRINTYLSEGDLVPPLQPSLRPVGKSTSKTSNSNNSVLSTDSSLSGIANTIGDDHDSDFSSLQRPQRVKLLQRELEEVLSSSKSNIPRSPKLSHSSTIPGNNIEETEF